jgi:hypothetical protein
MDGVQFAPDCILPVQYFHRPQHSFSAGAEGKLMLAVFQDAIDCYRLNLNRTGRRAARELREVSEWFNAVNCHDLFAFETICAVFGIDARAVRHALRKLNAKATRSRQVRTRSGVLIKKSRDAQQTGRTPDHGRRQTYRGAEQ